MAALAAASAAAAQEAAPVPADPEIVVTAKQDLDRQISEFVGALAPAPPGSQLARFEWKICPVAVGLPARQADAIVGRMRRVAAAAGMPVSDPACRPNVVVVVTDDKGAFVKGLGRRKPTYFDGLPLREVRRLAKAPGPAVAWQLPGPPLDAGGFELREGPGYHVNDTTRPPSRITAAARPQFAAAIVVVEMKALDGLTTVQLADYAAMRAFAKVDPARLGPSAPATILTILDAPMGSPVPITLTPWDLGFLKGLYASSENLYAGSQRSEIRERLKEELQAPEKGKP